MSLLIVTLLSLLVPKVLHYKDANETNILLYSIKKKLYIIPIIQIFTRFILYFQVFIILKLAHKKNHQPQLMVSFYVWV